MYKEDQQMYERKIYWKIWREEYWNIRMLGEILVDIRKEFGEGDEESVIR